MRPVVAACLALLLSSCLDWVVPGDYDKRGYAGPIDPLTLGNETERAEALAERFRLIQAR